MSKPRVYGAKTSCIPNREADMRRRNNAYWRGREFAENDLQRAQDKRKRSLVKQRGDDGC